MSRSFKQRFAHARAVFEAEAAKAAQETSDRPAPPTTTAPAPAPARKPGDRPWHVAPTASFKGTDGALYLYADGVDHNQGFKSTTIPIGTIQSVTIEDGADLEARITATRLILVGVFALAFRKRRGGEKYLAIEADEHFVVVQVDRKSIAKAQQFAAAVRTATKGARP